MEIGVFVVSMILSWLLVTVVTNVIMTITGARVMFFNVGTRLALIVVLGFYIFFRIAPKILL